VGLDFSEDHIQNLLNDGKAKIDGAEPSRTPPDGP